MNIFSKFNQIREFIFNNIFNTPVKVFAKITVWLCITLIFGLFQAWHVIILDHLSWGGSLSFLDSLWCSMHTISKDGILLLFSMTIVTSVTIDYQLSDPPYKNKTLEIFNFTWFPIMIISISIWLFTEQEHLSVTNINKLTTVHVLIFISTCIYAFFTKRAKFLNEQK